MKYQLPPEQKVSGDATLDKIGDKLSKKVADNITVFDICYQLTFIMNYSGTQAGESHSNAT